MKKLLMIAATTTALLTSTSFADMENTFYAKANVGGSLMNKATDKNTGLKMKSKTAVFAGLGVGYYVMDNVRTDLVYDHFFNAQLKKSGNVNNVAMSANHKANIDSLLLNGYIDAFDVSVANVFLGGGVGVAMVKEKVSFTKAGVNTSGSTKRATNFAYALYAGASFEVAPGAKTELVYSWRDAGKSKNKNVNGVDFGKTSYKGHNLALGVRFDM